MNDLGVEVSRRLNEINVRGRVLTLKVLARAPGAPVETPKACSFTKRSSLSH
jgi:DNA repair protein REV1